MALNMNMVILSAAILGGAAIIASSDNTTTVTTTGEDGQPVSAERAEIEQIVVDTIMAKPEMIIESIEAMQEKQAAAEQDQARQAVQAYSTSLFEDTSSPFAGNPDGDVVVVEFFDYNCGYCKRSLPNVARLIDTDANVKVILKDYPVLSPTSETAARAALAVNEVAPDKYFDYHAALFNLGGKFDEANLAAVAVDMGIEEQAFLDAMKSDAVSEQLDENQNLARKLGARGVPLFVIGDEMFPGAIPFEQMKSEVERTREAQS